MEFHDRYYYELGKCKHYELKCAMYADVDEEKHHKYLSKLKEHKRMVQKYYNMTKENPVFTDFLGDESLYTDSSYFKESSLFIE